MLIVGYELGPGDSIGLLVSSLIDYLKIIARGRKLFNFEETLDRLLGEIR